ncbi:MAG: PorP/SprF family type IX secretion system membrane protein [Saprospiraceae bacterium]
MKTLFCICCLAFCLPLPGQQTPLFSIYRDQWGVLNPAALSNNYLLNNRTMTLSGAWHVQWWGLPQSPRTQTLAWEMVEEDKNSVFGAHIMNDQTGAIGQTGVYGRYAYRIQLSGRRSSQSLLIGLNAGAVQYRANLNEIDFPDPSTAPAEAPHTLRPDLGLGVFYHYTDRYYAGISIPQTLGFRSTFSSAQRDFSIRRVPHLYAVAGGYFSTPWLGNETSFVEPSVWVKYLPNSPLNLDLNLRAQVSELVWAGTGVNLGFGLQPTVVLHFESGLFLSEQVQLVNSQFKVGFAFDLPVTQTISQIFGSSAEIMVVYSWR